ncbi:MAG: HEAT repeat domain-containing protein [Verrucomicrobiales bacterium]|nr:HEAT repeat domain-containing protein [Verrucomicrobiales bacterium]
MIETVLKTLTLFLDFFATYWPFLVPVLILALLIYVGRYLYAAYRWIDESISNNVLGHVSKLVSDGNDTSKTALFIRWTFILIFFGIFVSAFYFALYPLADVRLSSWLEIAAISICYIVALSVAKQWITNENAILDGNAKDKAVTRATRLKHEGFIAILVLVACVPISFHALNSLFLWHPEINDISQWAWFSLSLLYQAVSSVFDLLKFDNTPQIATPFWGLQVAVVAHMLVLTFIVVEGVISIAKSEFELYRALKAFYLGNNFNRIVPFGKRAEGALVRITKGKRPRRLNRPEFSDHEKPSAEVREAAARTLGKIGLMDRSTTGDVIEALKKIVKSEKTKNLDSDLRVAAVEGLTLMGKKLDPEELNQSMYKNDVERFLKAMVLGGLEQKRGNVQVLAKLAESLGEVKNLNTTGELLEIGKLCGTTGHVTYANSLATCLALYGDSELAGSLRRDNSIRTNLLKALAKYPNQSKIISALELYDENFEDSTALLLWKKLSNKRNTAVERNAAARALEEEVARDHRVLSLLLCHRNDKEDTVREGIARALKGASDIYISYRKSALAALKQYLKKDSDYRVRKCAANSLVNYPLDDRSILTALARQLLKDQYSTVVEAIAETMRKRGNYKELLPGLGIPKNSCRRKVVSSLEKVCNRIAIREINGKIRAELSEANERKLTEEEIAQLLLAFSGEFNTQSVDIPNNLTELNKVEEMESSSEHTWK